MKIDEPKTPFAPQYDPTEDEEEMQMAEAEESLIDAQDVRVDELERGKKVVQKRPVTEEEIPELELGEAEESHPAGDEEERIVRERRASHDGEKHVVVGGEGEGVEDELLSPEEAEEKHRKFEERRKRHYEMRNVKEILAYVSLVFGRAAMSYLLIDYRHPEELDEMDEDEEDEQPTPPPVPKIPERFHK